MSSLPTMNSGGVSTSRDLIEQIMCGTTLVGIHTVVMYRGYKAITDMIEGVEAFMERKGYKSLQAIRGMAVPQVDDFDKFFESIVQSRIPKEEIRLILDSTKCTGCGRCAVCLDGAITMEEDLPRIDLELCDRCGVCESLCPVDALTLKVRG